MDNERRVTERLAARVGGTSPNPEVPLRSFVFRRRRRTLDSERVRAAIVFTASGNMGRLRAELDLARIDWRDVLMNGGLAHEDWPAKLDRDLVPVGPDAD